MGTVSRVLNGRPGVSDEARSTILAVVEKNSFRLNRNAKQLKQRGSESVAVIVKGAGNLLFAGILERIQSRVRANRRAAAVYYLDEDSNEVEQAVQITQELKPQGVLFLGGDRANFLAGFNRVQCPCVLVSAKADDLGFSNLSSVSTDDVEGAGRAMGYLLDIGHRNVGVIGGQSCFVSPEALCNTSQLRLTGCIRACAGRGVPFDPERQTIQSHYSMKGGYDATLELLKRRPGVTALFAMCDVMAVGAIRALRDMGLRVPEDVSVIGYDGIELGQYLAPKLATIMQDQERMARRSVELLLAQISGEAAALHELIPFQLLPGESARERNHS